MKSAFSKDQISRYLDHVDFPKHLRSPDQPRDLELLHALHVHHISTFPYENLSLHYNPAHTNDLDPQKLFKKFLDGTGRGGYCMETCILMREILKGMGFRTFVAGARIRLRDPNGVPGGDFVSWVHCVNVVTLSDGSRYHIDVGFGGDGPTRPVPIGDEQPLQNLGAQEVRVIRDRLPGTSPLEKHYWWVYQYRNGSDRPWLSYYAFPELEFLQVDLDHQNFWIINSMQSPQPTHIIMTKFIRGQDAAGKPVILGKRTLFDQTVKENMGGKTKVIAQLETESERVQAFKDLFDLELNNEEVQAIRGWRTEIVTPEQVAIA